MFRWLLVTVLLAAACVAIVLVVGPMFESKPAKGAGRAAEAGSSSPNRDAAEPDRPSRGEEDPKAEGPRAQGEIQIVEIKGGLGAGPSQPLIVQDCRMLSLERQEVPAER